MSMCQCLLSSCGLKIIKTGGVNEMQYRIQNLFKISQKVVELQENDKKFLHG
jgi:hypothetical protein